MAEQRVERHVIRQSDSRYAAIDGASFAAKELYNVANYQTRQSFCAGSGYVSFPTLNKALKASPYYRALPAKVAQQVLRMLDQNWQSFFAANSDFKQNPGKYKSCPSLPHYLRKDGRYTLVYTIQAIGRRELKRGLIKPSGLGLTIPTQIAPEAVSQTRIVKKIDHYVVEVIYRKEEPAENPILNYDHVVSFDIGVNNLLALTSNKPGFRPALVSGGPLKSLNQYYNKSKASLTSRLEQDQVYLERVRAAKKEHLTAPSSQRLGRLSTKRYHKIQHYLHCASKQLLDAMVAEGIGTLVIGYNPGWKQEAALGKRNNQNFVCLPFARLIEMLQYKAAERGIVVIVHEESYTSKTSFLDLEPLAHQQHYRGRRLKRGLFKSSSGQLINADVNGSYNILRKAIPDAFADGIEAVVVRPERFSLNTGTVPKRPLKLAA